MTRADQQLLFTALGFVAVTMQEGQSADNGTRVQVYAHLIEQFCRSAVPDAFEDVPATS